jgi:hypothetical protein
MIWDRSIDHDRTSRDIPIRLETWSSLNITYPKYTNHTLTISKITNLDTTLSKK